MCLDRIDLNIVPCEVGYKIFYTAGTDNLYGEWKTTNRPRPIGVWLDEKDFRPICAMHVPVDEQGDPLIKAENGEVYKIGWHVFHTREDAETWLPDYFKVSPLYSIKKVEIKNPVATGIQHDTSPVTVCKYIFIEEDAKG
jgi:hypothetical protein